MFLCLTGQVSYVEVEHWMWRLFLDDFGQVCRDLGLPSLPLSSSPQTALPAPTHLLYGVSSVVLPRQPYCNRFDPFTVAVCNGDIVIGQLYVQADGCSQSLLKYPQGVNKTGEV